MNRILEICVDSLLSARAAIVGGADRLELCSALTLGGLTPYCELFQQIREESNIPIRCLIRPRPGDFLYSKEEVNLICRQIGTLKDAGADGFVIGCLTSDGALDKAAMAALISSCGSCGITLHRAIDVSADLENTYTTAMELGVDTVLTSGGSSSVIAGMEKISQLIALRDQINGPEVLIGAGVNAEVISYFRQNCSGARAFHMSGKILVESGMHFRKQDIPMGLPGLDEWHIQQTCPQAVAAARSTLYSER